MRSHRGSLRATQHSTKNERSYYYFCVTISPCLAFYTIPATLLNSLSAARPADFAPATLSSAAP